PLALAHPRRPSSPPRRSSDLRAPAPRPHRIQYFQFDRAPMLLYHVSLAGHLLLTRQSSRLLRFHLYSEPIQSWHFFAKVFYHAKSQQYGRTFHEMFDLTFVAWVLVYAWQLPDLVQIRNDYENQYLDCVVRQLDRNHNNRHVCRFGYEIPQLSHLSSDLI